MRYVLSADLGQANDYSALSVVERVGEELHVPYLNRPPLRTSYERIAKGIVDRLCQLEHVGAFGERADVGCVLDGTGVGRGVTDMVLRELRERRTKPVVAFWPLVITGGNTVSRTGAYISVPKRNLIISAVSRLQTGRLKIGADVPERDTLISELRDYRLRINVKTGHDSYEPWRENQHDDLLFSLCMGCWFWEFVDKDRRAA